MAPNLTIQWEWKEAVSWCYRIFLGREPENETVLNRPFTSLRTLRDSFLDAEEYKNTCKEHHASFVQRLDRKELVTWCFRIIAGREPSGAEELDLYVTSLSELRNRVMEIAGETGASPGLSTMSSWNGGRYREIGSPGINAVDSKDVEKGSIYAVARERTQSGCLMEAVAPRYPVGRYAATFRFRNFRHAPPEHKIRIEITHDGFLPLGELLFPVLELYDNPEKTVDFFVIEDTRKIHFQVFVGDETEVAVSCAIEVTHLGVDVLAFVDGVPDAATKNFMQAHLVAFMQLERLGGLFYFRDECLHCSIDGLTFQVRDTGDLQVLNEVFTISSYNILLPYDAVAIDVGMNVGIVSLALAKNEKIRRVHGFEPFALTYARALDNFALNHSIAKKIKPYNLAWGASDDTVTVDYDSGGSVAMSVRNQLLSSDNYETVTIVSAENILNAIVAEEGDIPIVLKMDCEGSEFGVFKLLDECGALRRFSVIMLEYHKLYSPDLSCNFIRSLLKKNGFSVIDNELRVNCLGSMLYAMRQ